MFLYNYVVNRDLNGFEDRNTSLECILSGFRICGHMMEYGFGPPHHVGC
jgi:hypothetical protein